MSDLLAYSSNYTLVATPSANGKTGRPVTTSFRTIP